MSSRRSFLNLCMALAVARRTRADTVGGGAAGGRAAGEGVAGDRVADEVAAGSDGDLAWIELPLSGERAFAERALVMYPKHRVAGQTFAGLLLFHGRGETANVELAIHAWRTRYGLARSDARLRRPPIELVREEQPFIDRARLARLNAALIEKPFTGLVIICPFTPNPHRATNPEAVLDRYSEWIEHTLLPAVRAHAPLDATAGIGVDGCSMGGYVAAEVFVRKPHLFRSFGVVQPAFGEHRVARYARHLAQALSRQTLRAIHLQTSSGDPYRGAVKALARHLKRQGARFTLEVLPGPHDQRWLRAAGTLAMLKWHDDTLR